MTVEEFVAEILVRGLSANDAVEEIDAATATTAHGETWRVKMVDGSSFVLRIMEDR